MNQVRAAHRSQRERIEQLEALINRFRYKASKTKQVQSRTQELERMEIVDIPPEEKTIRFRLPQPVASGRGGRGSGGPLQELRKNAGL